MRQEFVEEMTTRLMLDLEDFIKHACQTRKVSGHPILDYADLQSECYLKIFQVVDKYGSNVAYVELVKICKTSILHRLATLRYQYLITGRKAELRASVIVNDEDEVTSNETCNVGDDYDLAWGVVEHIHADAAKLYDSIERMAEIEAALDGDTLRVFRAFMGSDPHVQEEFALYIARRNFVFKNPKIMVSVKFVADALNMNERRVRKCVNDIKEKVKFLYTDLLA